MPAACAAIAKGTRVAAPAKSANDPVLSWRRTAVWSSVPSRRMRTGWPASASMTASRTRISADRALRRAQHASGCRRPASPRAPCPRPARAASCRAPRSAQLQTVRARVDVLGHAQPAQQRADVDVAGGQIELRDGRLAAQVELDQRRERRARELAASPADGNSRPSRVRATKPTSTQIGAAELHALQREIEVGVAQVDGRREDRRVEARAAAGASALRRHSGSTVPPRRSACCAPWPW